MFSSTGVTLPVYYFYGLQNHIRGWGYAYSWVDFMVFLSNMKPYINLPLQMTKKNHIYHPSCCAEATFFLLFRFALCQSLTQRPGEKCMRKYKMVSLVPVKIKYTHTHPVFLKLNSTKPCSFTCRIQYRMQEQILGKPSCV